MARKPAREHTEPDKTNRERIIAALMALLAEQTIEKTGFGAIAGRAGLTLAECRAEFGSVLGVLAAHMKEIDRQVLAGGDADMAEEPARVCGPGTRRPPFARRCRRGAGRGVSGPPLATPAPGPSPAIRRAGCRPA